MDLEAIDIEPLIIADILGSIIPEEKALLVKLMAERPELRELYDSIRKDLENNDLATIAAGKITAAELIEKAEHAKQKARIRIIKIMVAAACTVGAIGVAAYYLLSANEPDHQIALKYDNDIRLAVGDKVIDLEKQSASLNLNGYTLRSSAGALNYIDSPEERPQSATGGHMIHSTAVLTVPRGKGTYSLSMQDGSVIVLNADSRVEFPLSFRGSTQREISISGEAYVTVAANAEQPFTVHLPDGKNVDVLGTEFNLNTYDSGIAKISLVKGSVRVRAGNKSQLLTPGNTATIDRENIGIRPFKQQEILGWQQGLYSLSNSVTIETIAAVVNRVYNRKMVIEPSAAGKRFYNIVINKNEPLEKLLQVLTATKEITYNITKDEVIHIR